MGREMSLRGVSYVYRGSVCTISVLTILIIKETGREYRQRCVRGGGDRCATLVSATPPLRNAGIGCGRGPLSPFAQL